MRVRQFLLGGMHLPGSRYIVPFIFPDVERPGPGVGWEAGRRGRRGCAELRVSMSMCLSFTPPLSAATTTAAATVAAGVAAAPSLARRRYLLGQVRSNPARLGEIRETFDNGARAPPGAAPRPKVAGRKHVPAGAASCLLVKKPLLCPVTITCTAYQCPRVKTRYSAHLAAPGERGSEQGLATRLEVAGAHRLLRGTARCRSQGSQG